LQGYNNSYASTEKVQGCNKIWDMLFQNMEF